MQRFLIRCSFAFVLTVPSPFQATPLINTEDCRESQVSMYEFATDATLHPKDLRSSHREVKKQIRLERRIHRVENWIAKRIAKKAPDGFSDPVNRFFWYWILAWGAGIILTLLAGGAFTTGGLAILWFTLFVGGAVSLVLWLVKRFG